MHNWPAFCSVAAQRTALVLGEAQFKIVCMASIVAAVIAAQEVSVECHCVTLALARVLRQAQHERVWELSEADIRQSPSPRL